MGKKSLKNIKKSEAEIMNAMQAAVGKGVIKQAKARGIRGVNKRWLKSFIGDLDPAPVANGMMTNPRAYLAEATLEGLQRSSNDGDEVVTARLVDRRWKTSSAVALLDRRQAGKDARPVVKRLSPHAMLVLQPTVVHDDTGPDDGISFSFEWRGLLIGPRLHDEIESRVQAQSRAMQPIGGSDPIIFERIGNSPDALERAARITWSLSPESFALEDDAAVEAAAAFRLAMLLGSVPLHRLTMGTGDGEDLLRAILRVAKARAAGQGSWAKTLAHPDRIPRDLARVMDAGGFGGTYALPYVRLR